MMKRFGIAAIRLLPAVLLAALCLPQAAESAGGGQRKAARRGAAVYYPGPGDDWRRKAPEEAGMDSRLLDEAVAFANAHPTSWPTDLSKMLADSVGREPHGEIVGPVKERGTVNGMIVRGGYIVAEWGDTRRVDMTFSATKSYVSTTVGLAYDRGLIRDIHEPVGKTVKDGGFDSPHNARITWHHLLQQTNEWEGTLWGKPDTADRRKGRDRKLEEPGAFYEYNDVRVNRTALSSLRVWRKPLPQVLKELVMDPIGASDTWRWHGYVNSDVVIDGKVMKSVSGGGHWGGGLWISTRDHARFGLLFLRRGRWNGRQLISEKWIDMATRPGDVYPRYGYMWWLNPNREAWPSAPEGSFAALGGNLNAVWIDPEHDLVVVVRWIENRHFEEFLKRVLAAVKEPAAKL